MDLDLYYCSGSVAITTSTFHISLLCAIYLSEIHINVLNRYKRPISEIPFVIFRDYVVMAYFKDLLLLNRFKQNAYVAPESQEIVVKKRINIRGPNPFS